MPSIGVAKIGGVAPDGRRYASWSNRAIGFAVDITPVLLLWFIAHRFFWSATTVAETTFNGTTYPVVLASGADWQYFALLAIAFGYWFANKGYFEGTIGKSLGKLVTKHHTEHQQTGSNLGAAAGFARALLVSFEWATIFLCGLGVILWIWPAFDPKRQALLSDRATYAVVLKD